MRALPDASLLRSKVERAYTLREAASSRLQATRREIKRLENEKELLDLVSELLRRLIDQAVTVGVQAVEHLQTEGLRSVFPDQDLRVRAVVDPSVHGKVSVELLTIQTQPDGTLSEGMSLDAFGGAVSTVQSVILRIIALLRRGMRPVLLLDETLPAVDGNYVTNVGRFLSVLCARLGLDIVAVTHNPALVEAADRSYRIVKQHGAARFEPLR